MIIPVMQNCLNSSHLLKVSAYLHSGPFGNIVLKDGVPVVSYSVEDVMEHRTSAELKGFGDVIRPQKLSKKELLERWALALEKRKGARLCTLRETEYKPVKEQLALRQENSPLTVAFEDPVLRSAGLVNDTFGEAARFFGLSNSQLHKLVCYCHFGETVAAETVAARVRYFCDAPSVAKLACGYVIASVVLTGIVWLSKAI